MKINDVWVGVSQELSINMSNVMFIDFVLNNDRLSLTSATLNFVNGSKKTYIGDVARVLWENFQGTQIYTTIPMKKN